MFEKCDVIDDKTSVGILKIKNKKVIFNVLIVFLLSKFLHNNLFHHWHFFYNCYFTFNLLLEYFLKTWIIL